MADTMPSHVDGDRSWFDRMAAAVAAAVARAPFFAGCLALVLIWAPSYVLVGDLDTYQLLINTPTTIITYLLVALLQNSQARADAAVQHKLNALAAGLAELLEQAGADPATRRELLEAVGLEQRESA